MHQGAPPRTRRHEEHAQARAPHAPPNLHTKMLTKTTRSSCSDHEQQTPISAGWHGSLRRPRPRIAGLDTCYRTSHTADAFWFGSPSRTATARLRREQDERYEEEADEPNQHPRLVSHLLPPAVPLDYRRHTVPPRTAAAADRAVPPACLLCPPAPPLGSPPIWPRPSNASAPQSAPTGREVRVGKPDALRRTPPCGLTHHPRSLPPGARRALLSANHGRRRAPRGGGGWDAPPLSTSMADAYESSAAAHPPRQPRHRDRRRTRTRPPFREPRHASS